MSAETGSSPLRPLVWLVAVGLALALAIPIVLSIGRGAELGEAPPTFGQVPDFALVNRDGGAVTRADLAGEAWIADFIFTRCALSCPLMTSRMIRVGAELPGVRRVSFTVDPDYDSPDVLASYADSYGIGDDRWLFLTGAKDELLSLVRSGFKLGVEEAMDHGGPEPITHSTRFVLVDPEGGIRGYYDALDEADLERLKRDTDWLLTADAQSR